MSEIIQNNSKYISLTLKEEHIADIIINFLGKKEKLKYREELSFLLRLNDIEQFYYLLNEKINKEQYTNIKLFTVSFLFNDNTIRVVNTIESLNKYLETRDVYPISVTMTWNVVLQFPNIETIETQKIELYFDIKSRNSIGYISINIEHTNQAWGIEVLNVIKNKILLISSRLPKHVEYARKIKDFITLKNFLNVTMIVLLLLLLLLANNAINKQTNSRQHTVLIEYKNGSISKDEFDEYLFIFDNLSYLDQISFINKRYSESESRIAIIKEIKRYNKARKRGVMNFFKFLIFVVISLFLFYIYLVKHIKYYTDKSFILTTNRSIQDYDNYMGIKRKVEFYSISLISFSIIIGLFVNYLYSQL